MDAEASIPTPVSISDENMDEDGDVVMGSPTAGTSANPIELTDEEEQADAPPVSRKASESGKLSPRRLYGLHVQQLTELWGDDDGVIRGELTPVRSFVLFLCACVRGLERSSLMLYMTLTTRIDAAPGCHSRAAPGMLHATQLTAASINY